MKLISFGRQGFFISLKIPPRNASDEIAAIPGWDPFYCYVFLNQPYRLHKEDP